ncbi:disintegrin and metalloproteinase domain-containing protein 2-like [Sphaerodactylus townsendi]|uniref:disintegrin and metalloproteinase domain-containing protein 2-like n=1 Tax=Sphaerodactylus townsendi TaxID=933632 RepID=UPI0020269F9A|nr:disintegrin and metalloproteinase domain-containing protein 2-like [Sphaerodactylus townsendi]
MLRSRLALLLLGAGFFVHLDCQTFLHITYPRKITANLTEDEEAEDKSTVSYTITIEEKIYTVHLKQQTFLPDDFMVYTYKKGGVVHPIFPYIKSDCFYQGYIEGFPNSLVILSTCSGLRGLLQFENISYGIEHLESSTQFEHLVFQINNKDLKGSVLLDDFIPITGEEENRDISHTLLSDAVPLQEITEVHRYVEMYIVLDKTLYNYFGGNEDVVTQKVVQLMGILNSIFTRLNVTIVLSSLEFWTDRNKISTSGEVDVLLQRFLNWKNSYLVLRPHDTAFLFAYREKPNYAGSTFLGKLCLRNYGAGVALYQKFVNLEIFSVIIAQLLSLSLGISYDDNKNCQCPGPVCIMNTEAVHSSGIKVFSSCSIEDFQHFIKHKGGNCLSNRPHLQHYKKRSAKNFSFCGNRIIEAGENCDCGSPEECKKSTCCTSNCKLQAGAVCSSEACCQNCKYTPSNTVCRKAMDRACDLPEYCNGTSASCPSDVYVQNGHACGGNTGFCYRGACQSADLRCRELFGPSARNAPNACYEEINRQTDRFGHCGIDPFDGYKSCSFQDFRCGKLICQYPNNVPFAKMKVPVLYTPVKNIICASLDMKQSETLPDPLLLKDGTKCGPSKVCINQVCENYEILKYDCDPKEKCSGHGICNNKKNCHCDPGWAPPNCNKKGSHLGGSVDCGIHILASEITGRRMPVSTKSWILLSLFFFLPVVVGSAILLFKGKRNCDYIAEEGDSQDYQPEDSSISGKESMSAAANAHS